jgi:hypothetical protein
MNVKVFVLSILGAVCSTTCLASTAIAPVIVTGEGHSYWDAREECVRQALQQSLPQLVIADRRIIDDKVIRDSVLSTMNGFVESVQVLEQTRTNDSVRLKAQVQISASGIENFVLSSVKGNAKINSDSLLGDISRDDLARTSRSQIVKRLFEGFPSRAFDVAVKKVELDPGIRGQVVVTVELQANKQFIKNLKSGLNVIGKAGGTDYQTADDLSICFSKGALYDNQVDGGCRTVGIDASVLKQQMFDFGSMGVGELSFLVWFSGGGAPSSPSVFEATYLRPNVNAYGPPQPAVEIAGDGRAVMKSFPEQVRGGINGQIAISEASHNFKIRISRQQVPEGATQIHAIPLFIQMRSNMPVVLNLFDDAPGLRSPEFRQFVDAAVSP